MNTSPFDRFFNKMPNNLSYIQSLNGNNTFGDLVQSLEKQISQNSDRVFSLFVYFPLTFVDDELSLQRLKTFNLIRQYDENSKLFVGCRRIKSTDLPDWLKKHQWIPEMFPYITKLGIDHEVVYGTRLTTKQKVLENTAPKSFKVKLHFMTGKQFYVEVNENSSVNDLKQIIENREGIPICQQRIIHAGLQLQDDTYLYYDYNIMDDTSLHVVLRLRGGMYDPSSGRTDFVQITKDKDPGTLFAHIPIKTFTSDDKQLMHLSFNRDAHIDEIVSLLQSLS